MNFPALSSREQRMIRLAAMVLVPSLGYVYGVKPYISSLAAMRDRLVVEQTTLVREQALIAQAARNGSLKEDADLVVTKAAPLLFAGRDNVIASAELAAHVTRTARAARVNLQQAATRPTITTDAGVRMLRIEVRGESDLQGIIDFLNALETGDKLIRFDRLDISRAPGRSTEEDGYETLMLAATITGFALDEVGPATASQRAKLPTSVAAQRGQE